jgi:hypothetical protein
VVAKSTKKKGAVSATVSVGIRIDPRIKYGIDLAARIQKRTVTGVVEWAIERALAEVNMPHSIFIEDEAPDAPTDLAYHLDDVLWSSNEGVRLVLLASRYPSLLSYEETRIWETIKLSPPFWHKLPRSADECTPWTNAKLDVIADNWRVIVEVVESRKAVSAITYADVGVPIELAELHTKAMLLQQHLEQLLIKDPELFAQVKEIERARDGVMLAIQEQKARLEAAMQRHPDKEKPKDFGKFS